MYETYTFDYLLGRMLERVPASIDKREGSVIYDACAPAAAELAELYIQLELNANLSFADTAAGDYLNRRTAEFGVNRKAATKAVRTGLFYGSSDVPLDVPQGSRYSINGLGYVVTARIDDGQYALTAESAGTAGNQSFGALLPLDYIPGLVRAELTDVLVPGEDEETDEALRQRYYEAVNEPAFGGNVADYEQKVDAIDGVGGTKVFPVWDGGGTVKCTVIASDWGEPSSGLVSAVQAAVDPIVNSGKGFGIAPIGHRVTIAGAVGLPVNIETTVTLAGGVTLGQVQPAIEAAVAGYLLELRQSWAGEAQLVARTAQIDARILAVSGVEDVTATKLNGSADNMVLGEEEIPLPGTVTVHG